MAMDISLTHKNIWNEKLVQKGKARRLAFGLHSSSLRGDWTS
jgi:hypothetical protein